MDFVVLVVLFGNTPEMRQDDVGPSFSCRLAPPVDSPHRQLETPNYPLLLPRTACIGSFWEVLSNLAPGQSRNILVLFRTPFCSFVYSDLV